MLQPLQWKSCLDLLVVLKNIKQLLLCTKVVWGGSEEEGGGGCGGILTKIELLMLDKPLVGDCLEMLGDSF